MIEKQSIEIFWKWFLKNEPLFYFGTDNENEREILFNKVSEQLKVFNDTIVYEFSPPRKDNTKEFCISADGMKEAFNDVKRIVTLHQNTNIGNLQLLDKESTATLYKLIWET